MTNNGNTFRHGGDRPAAGDRTPFRFAIPAVANVFLERHAALLAASYRRWTGQDLVEAASLAGPASELARALFDAPVAIVSHGTEPDPIFNYGNATALRLFEMTWVEFTCLPSRMSAEPVHRDERRRLMDTVTRDGFIADYAGIRISKTGRRFHIERATVWNLMDDSGKYRGQAAMFGDWRPLNGGADTDSEAPDARL